MKRPQTTLTVILVALLCNFVFVAEAQQSVWHYKTRSITVTEDGKSRVSIFKDSSKTPFEQRTNDVCPPNIDFEQGNFSNWQCYTGTAATTGTGSAQVNLVSNIVATNPVSGRHTIISSTSVPTVDPYGGFPVRCPNGSGYSVKLGNSSVGSQAERISYTFTVPASANDFNILYNYAVVFQNPQSGHTAAQQPRFQARVYDAATGNGISCATYDFIATAGLPGFTANTSCNTCNPAATTGNPVLWKNWTPVSINLSGYAGSNVILEFTTEDCSISGHFGYAYLDVSSGCSGLVSGAAYCQGATSVQLNAPSGYQTYNWYNNDYTQLLGTGPSLTLTPPPATNSIIRIDLIPYPGFGCRDTVFTTVTVNPNPVANFSTNAGSVCLGESPTFTNGSTISAGTINYQWSFGDNTSSSATNPTHTYPAVGNYNVKLVATSNIGCKDSITKSVSIAPNPVANFDITSLNRQCITNNNFTFQNTSPGGAGINYTWSFGDGNTSNQNTPSHTYATANTYNVKLFAVQSVNALCKDSMTKQVVVEPSPTVNFSFYNGGRQCIRNNQFHFKNNSTAIGPLTYAWDFGDGNTSLLAEPTHSYLVPGTYQVKLVAYAIGLCKDSISIPVIVDPNPSAVFQVTSNTAQCQDKNLFTFQNNSTVSDGSALTYAWNFADGNTSAVKDAQHSYTNYGNFTVRLITTTANNCADTTTANVVVYPKPITAITIVGGSEQCNRSNNFSFQNATTIPSGTFTQLWRFDDGSTTATFDANHSYPAPGNYTVTLIATSNNVCFDSISKNIIVNPDPVSAFSINDATQCLKGNSFSFSNNSSLSSGTLNYSWSFGDATTSTQQHPVKSYSAFATSYPVRLIVSSNKGCNDTLLRDVFLYQTAPAAFNITSADKQCENGNSFTFINNSTFPAPVSYLWKFGDGTTSTQTNAAKNYTATGPYNVSLIVTTAENGCADTLTKQIEVFANPVAAFNINNASQCLTGNAFSFSANSPVASYQYQWTFGDGGIAANATTSHSYATAGSFPVKLIVDHVATPGLTCSDTTSQNIIVRSMPVGLITNKGTYDLCQGSSKTLTAAGGVNYQWFLNGVAITGAVNANYNATVEGTYTLDAINQFGCRAASSDKVQINEIKKPAANFTYDSYCIDKPVKFINTTVPGAHNIVQYSWDLGHGGVIADPSSNPQHTYGPAGNYKVKLTVTSSLCPDHLSTMEKSINIVTPAAGIRYPAINAVVGHTYTLTARTLGAKFQWIPATDLSNQFSRTPILSAAKEQDYKVVLTASSGCQTTDSIRILIFGQSQVFVPAAFTPNNDGLNDVLYPILVGIKELKYFRVYNRWGNLVFSTHTASNGWNGIYNGQLQPSETYTWVVEAIDEKGKNIRAGGNTILIR